MYSMQRAVPSAVSARASTAVLVAALVVLATTVSAASVSDPSTDTTSPDHSVIYPAHLSMHEHLGSPQSQHNLGFCFNRNGKWMQPIGASCRCFHECASLACNRRKCVCSADSHCKPDEICVRRTLFKNYCKPTGGPGTPGRPLGSFCLHGGQCASGRCEWGKCVCNRNSDCGSGKRCKRRIGRNKCV